jgi:hypothetical protein
MVRDTKKDRDDPGSARRPGERGTAGGETGATSGTAGGAGGTGSHEATGSDHHVAKAHGRPAAVDTTLPGTRAELMALHAEARRRRNAASGGSEDFRAAVDQLGRIEIRIAAIDREADPPLG